MMGESVMSKDINELVDDFNSKTTSEEYVALDKDTWVFVDWKVRHIEGLYSDEDLMEVLKND